jgi:hypothetical protein
MLSKAMGSLAAGVLLLAPAPAQVTQTAVFPSPGSQANSATAALWMTAIVQAPGELASPLVNVMGAGSLSSTLAYTAFGSTTFPQPGTMALAGALRGTPGAPLVLGLSVRIGGTFCGGFAGWPCMTGPLLFASIPTPFGTYHLDPAPLILLDGIGGTAPPAALDAMGQFPLAATLPVDTQTNGGMEGHFAVQAAILDPGSPGGLSLTAAFTVEEWIFYL